MSDEAIDVKEVLERVQNDYELLLELLDIFQDDYKEKRKAIAAAIEKKNAEEVRNLAHSLKGASSNISAKKIHIHFSQLEKIGETKNWQNAGNTLQSIDSSYTELADFIQKFKKKMKGL